jgi:murein DD-endopeptidase MepM/ murein hydrolase activator NlpD
MRLALLPAFLLAACASGERAPISYAGGAPARAERAPRPDEAPASTAPAPAPRHEADWADGPGAPLSRYALRPEDVQTADAAHTPRTHRVGRGEQLYDIATRYRIPMLALIEQNHLTAPYALTPGSELRLPPARIHIVAQGETFEDVAARFAIDPRSLALLNGMAAPYVVRPGDRLVLPSMASERESEPGAAARAEPPPAASSTARFAWPLNGEIVSRFGAHGGGVRQDGVEIAGREGDAIKAAADGDVVYAGADLPTYGTLVLVRHADDYVTAYGYARRALVREGQHVRAGQTIAELGADLGALARGSGEGRARLLFQVRRGSAAVDPLPLLAPQPLLGSRD